MNASLREAVIETIRERHKDMANLIVPPIDLDWRFGDETASMAGLCLHILDVEQHLTNVANGVDDDWQGENGSRMSEPAPPFETLRDEIERVDRALCAAVSNAADEALAQLIEDLDHCAMHYGQMQITRHLWETAHPGERTAYAHWR